MQTSKTAKQSNSKPATKAENQGTFVVIGPARFSYLNALAPRQTPGGKPKYSVSLLIPKKDKEMIRKIEKAIAAAAVAGASLFGNKDPHKIKNFSWPLRDGDEEREDEAYAGHKFVNAKSDTKPQIVDKNRQEIIDADEIYSGMYGRASVNFYPFNYEGKLGIAAGLNNLQKLKDGENLTGRKSAEEDFDDEYVFDEGDEDEGDEGDEDDGDDSDLD